MARNPGLSDVQILSELFESSSDDDDLGDSSGSDAEFVPDEPVGDQDSNSELEVDSEDEQEQHSNGEESYLGKDKVTLWSKAPPPQNIRTRRHNIITHLPGCKGVARNATTPLQAFLCFFDNDVIECLVFNTNIFIQKVRPNFSRERDARSTDPQEMKALLGLLLLSGVLQASHLNIKDLFSSDGLGPDVFHLTMPYNRFLFMLRCLRFDNVHDRVQRRQTDKLAAIRQLFDIIVAKCADLFTPSEYLTIDEQLIGFRGRCGFRQYLPLKPKKYGIKIFANVDARTFYNLKMEVYVGKQPDGPYQVQNTPAEIVNRLVGPISGSGRHITMDNWYSSIPLAVSLLEDHKLTMTGTLRKNKAQIPPEFLPQKSREIKSSLFGFRETCTLVSYVPKKSKAVVLISTLHNNSAIDAESGDQQKPEIITFYNSTKGGVDTNDQLCASYGVG